MAELSSADDGSFVAFFPGVGGIRLRPLNIEQDAADIHDWVNRDYARFWGMRGSSLERVRHRFGPGLVHEKAYMAVMESSGTKMALFLTYPVTRDVVGRYFACRPSDLGVHTLIAPAGDVRLKDISYFLMKALQLQAFSDPAVERLICEPDVSNAKVLVRFRQAGYLLGKPLFMPHKTARLEYLTRDRFNGLSHDQPPAKPAIGVFSRFQVRGVVFWGRVLRKLGLVTERDPLPLHA